MLRTFDPRLTQQQLGERSGIPQETLSRIERGRIPAFPTLKKLAKALNATVLILPDERVLLTGGTVSAGAYFGAAETTCE